MDPHAHKIRILIVDDSAIVRGQFGGILEAEEDFKVVSTAAEGKSALAVLAKQEVDVVLLDLQMPVMDGMTTLSHIVRDFPKVRVIIASSLTSEGAKETIQALEIGAVDYITKPSTASITTNFENVKRQMIEKVRFFGKRTVLNKVVIKSAKQEIPPPPVTGVARVPTILVIGSSTGGPNALHEVLKGISPQVTLPILITQHMPPMFTAMLAERLAAATGRPCMEGKEGQRIEPGRIYVAPGDYHMVIKHSSSGNFLVLNQEPPEHFCRPSVNPMFRSAAGIYKEDLLGVMLTGMGDDGIEGARDIVTAGGRMLAQDEATSVVWGMPGAVAKAGLASEVIPLPMIAGRINKICGSLA